ncbi:MAG: hypothetical protein CM15mP103_06740 [Gammaproteobacteria bacterium]|nr:MAG: hypothetical protein CM15mP103_06740 [Gammaproteobacteria bacterium]
MVDGARIVDLNADDQTVPIILEAGADKSRPQRPGEPVCAHRSGALIAVSCIVPR